MFAATILLVALCVVSADLAYIYLTNRLNQIPRIAVSGLQPAGAGDPQNILVTGSDSRANESVADAQHFGSATDVSGQRSDVIVLIHLDPRTAKAAMLSIPRDTFVPIAARARRTASTLPSPGARASSCRPSVRTSAS